MINIPLTQGKYAIVDDADYPHLFKHRWHVVKQRDRYVVSRCVWEDGKAYPTKVYMHRVITGCPRGMVVDHVNHNTLDNRRENLRVCTTGENSFNQRKWSRKTTSRFKGVFRRTKGGKWYACLRYCGSRIEKGPYMTEELAAAAYNEMALRFHGEFAKLNQLH